MVEMADTALCTKISMIFANDLFKKNKHFTEAGTRLYEFLGMEENTDNVLKKHFSINPDYDMVSLSENTINDMQLDIWSGMQCSTAGGRNMLIQMLSAPTTDISLLNKRQESIKHTDMSWEKEFKELAGFEKDILWIYTLPKTFHDVWPIPLMFPSFPFLNRINHYPSALGAYHMYRIWLTPFLQLFIPTISILGPWLYLRYRIKWNISLLEYFQLVKFVFTQSMLGADWKQKISRYGTIILYILMFIYGFIQTIDVSRMLHLVKNDLHERISRINEFIDRSYNLLSKWDVIKITKPQIPKGTAGIYAVWTDKKLQKDIKEFLQKFYELDISLCCKSLITNENWCYAKYITKKKKRNQTVCQGLCNPLLGKTQISNPMCLLKNVIITGPNAAGKSTYVRSIGANMICAQSIGICNAKFAHISPVDAILSYMRIRDLIGDKSLFETEVAHCSDILKKAIHLENDGKSAIIFFDEPMHSTPALEGEAAAYAVLQYLGTMKNIRTVVTSHYHRITVLGSSKDEKDNEKEINWMNLCMDAVHDKKSDTYSFPYSIRRGASYQSIALELLRGKGQLPASIVQNAIKFKSTINKS